MEGVFREMHAIMTSRLTPEFVRPFVATTWRARLDELIERRSKAFEEMLPIKTAADARRYTSNFLQKEHKKVTRLQREALRDILPAGLTKGDMLEALDLIEAQGLKIGLATSSPFAMVEAVLGKLGIHDPLLEIALFGGQGSLNVNSWPPDGRRFAFVAYPCSQDDQPRLLRR